MDATDLGIKIVSIDPFSFGQCPLESISFLTFLSFPSTPLANLSWNSPSTLVTDWSVSQREELR